MKLKLESIEIKNKGGAPRKTAKQAAVALAYHYFLPSDTQQHYPKQFNHKILKFLAEGRKEAPFPYSISDPVGGVRRVIKNDGNPVTNLLKSAEAYTDQNTGEVKKDGNAILVKFETIYGTNGAAVIDRPIIKVGLDEIVVSGTGWVWTTGRKTATYGAVSCRAVPSKQDTFADLPDSNC